MNKFIVFEGLSGSGKTTTALELTKIIGGTYLKSPIEPFNVIRKSVETQTNITSQYLFYLANLKHLSDEVSKILPYSNVILDKYIYTTLAYNKAIGNDVYVPDFVELLMPDYYFLLNVNEDLRLNRILHRDGSLIHRVNNLVELERRIQEELLKLKPTIISNNNLQNDTLQSVLKLMNHI